MRAVVAGVDGSQNALDAVAWAARDAESRQTALRLVHAFTWPLLRIPRFAAAMGPAGGLREHAREVLDEAAEVAARAAPGLPIRSEVKVDFGSRLLIEESRGACCVVVGSRGWGRVGGMLAGSTSADLAAHAHAPVVVVRETPSPEQLDAPVLVGLDGSPSSEAALREAVDAAVRRDVPLIAVNVGSPHAGRLLDRSLGPWRELQPRLKIEQRVRVGHPAGVLAEMSEEAALLVVGSHGRGGFTGMLLGSVSQALLHHAGSPLMVVPGPERVDVPSAQGTDS